MKLVRRVWDELAKSPEEADDLAERAELMITLRVFLDGVHPNEVETRYGVDPGVVSDILAGRIDLLSRRTLGDVMDAIVRAEGPLSTLDP